MWRLPSLYLVPLKGAAESDECAEDGQIIWVHTASSVEDSIRSVFGENSYATDKFNCEGFFFPQRATLPLNYPFKMLLK